MSWILDTLTTRRNALDTALDAVGMLEPHDTEWGGRAYTTPSLIDHDDRKNDDE